MRRSGAAVASVLSASVALSAGVGCGTRTGTSPADSGRTQATVWADVGLRAAVPARVGATRLRTSFDDSRTFSDRIARGERPDVVLLQASTFPAWDPAADRLAGSRVVARDALVLVTRRPKATPSAVGGPDGAKQVVLPGRGFAGELSRALVTRADGGGKVPHQIRVADSRAVLRAVLDNPSYTGLVLRSALRTAHDRARFNTQSFTGLGSTDVFVQAAYATSSPRAEAIVTEMAQPAGQRRFRSLGLDPPGTNPTVVECTKTAC